MGSEPNLSVKWFVPIGTMVNFAVTDTDTETERVNGLLCIVHDSI